jgi:hypothetical protein
MSATQSLNSSITHVQVAEKAPINSESPNVSPGHGESAVLEDKIEEEEILEDDWENDPENARNWPSRKKWTAVCIVRRLRLFFGSRELIIPCLLIL